MDEKMMRIELKKYKEELGLSVNPDTENIEMVKQMLVCLRELDNNFWFQN